MDVQLKTLSLKYCVLRCKIDQPTCAHVQKQQLYRNVSQNFCRHSRNMSGCLSNALRPKKKIFHLYNFVKYENHVVHHYIYCVKISKFNVPIYECAVLLHKCHFHMALIIGIQTCNHKRILPIWC